MSPIHQFNAKKQPHVEDESKENDIIDYLSLPEALSGKPRQHDDLASTKNTNGLLDHDAFRSLTPSPYSENGGRLSPFSVQGAPSPLPYSTVRPTWKNRALASSLRFWHRNRCVILVALAQFFAAVMNLSARLLELDGVGMNPFQILFARMALTTAFSCVYGYKKRLPDFPLGPKIKQVRWLLLVRAFSGFFGIFGMWYSMMYLPLAEATVISFLAPCLAGYVCHVLLHDPYTKKEQIATVVALVGVVFIARPASLFPSSGGDDGRGDGAGAAPVTGVEMLRNATRAEQQHHHHPQTTEEATPEQRMMAIGVALLGVAGGSVAFTTIRWVGDRVHALVSVNYFSACSMVVSLLVLLLAPVLDIGQPDLHFQLPASAKQWLLLLTLGTAGFVMQVMFTYGIAGEKSNRATAMVYTHMLFAASFDRWVFGHQMGVLSLIGCGLIVGSALWVVLTKKEEVKSAAGSGEIGDMEEAVEGVPMLRSNVEEGEGEGEGDIPLGQLR